MSKSEPVAKYIPFLRHYARALTGTQSSGDAYVAAALEALVEDPSVLESGRDPRKALFHMFTKIWKSVALNKTTAAVDSARPPEQRLANLRTLPRQAFLLMALEGFSEEDAAEILDCDITTLRRLVDEAGRELAAEIATDVLIIEDEALIAIDLETLVRESWSSGDWCGAHPCGGGQPDSGDAAWPNPGRYSACGRKFRSRCRERVVALVRGAGHLHYCVSRALSDWRAAGTSVSYFKTVSAIDVVGNPQPSAVLRTHRQARSAQTCLTFPKQASQAPRRLSRGEFLPPRSADPQNCYCRSSSA